MEGIDTAAKVVRNCLKVYQALSFLLVRDAELASKLLLEGIATFSCSELCTYPESIMYATMTNLLYLKQTKLKKSIIDGSEVLQVSKEIPVVVRMIFRHNHFLSFLGVIYPILLSHIFALIDSFFVSYSRFAVKSHSEAWACCGSVNNRSESL